MDEMDDLTHKIEVTISGIYTGKEKEHASVIFYGDGSIDHMRNAFLTAIVAAGFEPKTAQDVTNEY